MQLSIYNLKAGSDAGNTRSKFSYLNKKGNISSFSIPTMVAPADSGGDRLKKESKEITNTDRLHVYIQSKSLSGTYYYVGDYARDKDDMEEPDGTDKSTSELHMVAQLTGLAIAGAIEDEFNISHSYSGGLPIEEFKKVGEDLFLSRIKGVHVVEFLDGVFRGKKVTINIEGGQVNIEGATTSLALTNNIVENKIEELSLAKTFDEESYCIADLGAGTTDVALFEEDGLNGINSTNYPFGTNTYIDALLKEISGLKQFEEARKFLKDNDLDIESPFSSREQFINQVIVPQVNKMIADKKYEPKFEISWASIRNVNITENVLKHMKQYFDEVEKKLNVFAFTKAPNIENFYLVGGGILFAYYYFKDIKFFKLPDEKVIAEAAYFTSRAYLLASYN